MVYMYQLSKGVGNGFARFKAGNFELNEKDRPDQPKRIEDNDLEALLN